MAAEPVAAANRDVSRRNPEPESKQEALVVAVTRSASGGGGGEDRDARRAAQKRSRALSAAGSTVRPRPPVGAASRTRLSDALSRRLASVEQDGGTLAAVGRSISEVDAVNRALAARVHRLLLGDNSIRSLRGLAQFTQVRALSLANNAVFDLEELNELTPLARLEHLVLQGNPVCDFPSYRAHAIAAAPQLAVLDGRRVSEQERHSAIDSVRQEESLLNLVLVNESMLAKLANAATKAQMHVELFSLAFGRIGVLTRALPPEYGAPQACEMDPSKVARLVEYPEASDPETRRALRRRLLRHVCMQWSNRVGGSGDGAKAGHEWEGAFAACSAAQHEAIALHVRRIEEANAKLRALKSRWQSKNQASPRVLTRPAPGAVRRLGARPSEADSKSSHPTSGLENALHVTDAAESLLSTQLVRLTELNRALTAKLSEYRLLNDRNVESAEVQLDALASEVTALRNRTEAMQKARDAEIAEWTARTLELRNELSRAREQRALAEELLTLNVNDAIARKHMQSRVADLEARLEARVAEVARLSAALRRERCEFEATVRDLGATLQRQSGEQAGRDGLVRDLFRAVAKAAALDALVSDWMERFGDDAERELFSDVRRRDRFLALRERAARQSLKRLFMMWRAKIRQVAAAARLRRRVVTSRIGAVLRMWRRKAALGGRLRVACRRTVHARLGVFVLRWRRIVKSRRASSNVLKWSSQMGAVRIQAATLAKWRHAVDCTRQAVRAFRVRRALRTWWRRKCWRRVPRAFAVAREHRLALIHALSVWKRVSRTQMSGRSLFARAARFWRLHAVRRCVARWSSGQREAAASRKRRCSARHWAMRRTLAHWRATCDLHACARLRRAAASRKVCLARHRQAVKLWTRASTRRRALRSARLAISSARLQGLIKAAWRQWWMAVVFQRSTKSRALRRWRRSADMSRSSKRKVREASQQTATKLALFVIRKWFLISRSRQRRKRIAALREAEQRAEALRQAQEAVAALRLSAEQAEQRAKDNEALLQDCERALRLQNGASEEQLFTVRSLRHELGARQAREAALLQDVAALRRELALRDEAIQQRETQLLQRAIGAETAATQCAANLEQGLLALGAVDSAVAKALQMLSAVELADADAAKKWAASVLRRVQDLARPPRRNVEKQELTGGQ